MAWAARERAVDVHVVARRGGGSGRRRAGSAGTRRRRPPRPPAPPARPGTAAARGRRAWGGDPASRRASLPRWTDMRYSTLTTPIGELLLVADPDGALTAVHLPGRHGSTAGMQRDDALLEPARRQLTEYFAGERTEFDLPLRPAGAPFQLRVWERLAAIPYGETASLRRDRARARPSDRLARRRRGQRPQPDRDRRPVPPRDRRQRLAHRLRRRPRPEARAARPRGRARGAGVKTYTLIGADGQPYQSAEKGLLGGNGRTKVYGTMDCPVALSFLRRGFEPKHRVFFADEADRRSRRASAPAGRACASATGSGRRGRTTGDDESRRPARARPPRRLHLPGRSRRNARPRRGRRAAGRRVAEPALARRGRARRALRPPPRRPRRVGARRRGAPRQAAREGRARRRRRRAHEDLALERARRAHAAL